jgi:predicted nucleic acid-binding protein
LTTSRSHELREEAEAVENILANVRRGTMELISSEALEDETRRTPSMERRLEKEALLSRAARTVVIDATITKRARELSALGYGLFDALHLAAAESANVEVLLSTGDRFVKRAARGVGNPRVPVRNPISWNRS